MLNIESEQVKTLPQRLADAMLTIPLYDPEWTNYNASDPGMTILETLSVSNIMLEGAMDFMPPMAKLKLLALAGITPRKAKNAKVLMEAEGVSSPMLLPANQKFTLGNMVFETDRITSLYGNSLTGVFTKKNGSDEFKDISYVLDDEVFIPAYIFGKKPVAGDEIYFYADSLPPVGEDVICYATFEETASRNPMTERNKNMFSEIVWECWCEDGFKELEPRDYTAGFLISGEVRFRIPEGAVEYTDGPINGYCIRARLTFANYDISPKLLYFSAFLFEVWQKETKCTSFTFQKPTDVRIYSDLAEAGYIRVFAKEEKGSSYRMYRTDHPDDEQGRFVDAQRPGFGQFEFLFDKAKYGFGPDRVKNAVRVVLYTEEAMRQYNIGGVLGYDNQRIDLPYDHIVRGSFCIVAERKTRDGEFIYDFARPDKNEPGSLFYHLLENEGAIVIEDAGDYIGANLYLACCATSRGDEGNVIRRKEFIGENIPQGISFSNAAPGVGGALSESFESMRERFLKDVHQPYVAVCAEDYENIAMSTPGLCIKKARAVMDGDLNLVEVVVLPDSEDEIPLLSETYKKEILEQLLERRLLTTRVELRAPRFVSVNIRGTVSVRRGYEKEAEEHIRAELKRACEYRNNDKTFGEALYYSEVFRALERIEDVDFVYDLSIRPSSNSLAKYVDGNIYPDKFVLCRLGNVDIEIIHS